ncbi:MAG: 30S ribosomal protein S17 [Chlamydiia bacterium]
MMGIVISDKMDRTIVVKVTTKKRHPKYEKVMSVSRKFYVHDETNAYKNGDEVCFEATRPISKLKRWKVCKPSNQVAV